MRSESTDLTYRPHLRLSSVFLCRKAGSSARCDSENGGESGQFLYVGMINLEETTGPEAASKFPLLLVKLCCVCDGVLLVSCTLNVVLVPMENCNTIAGHTQYMRSGVDLRSGSIWLRLHLALCA